MARIDAATAATGSGEATMTRLPDAQPATTASAGPAASSAEAGEATMTRLPDAAPVTANPVAAEPRLPAAPDLPQLDPTSWTVEPGDSLWAIADEVTRLPDGSSPGERAVARYWHRLIEANRSHLVDPANADLLVPGQHLVVPPVAQR
jgi:nucleoid-associated protein YgaU